MSIFDTVVMFNNYFKNLTLKALIITVVDDIFCNNFLHFGYKKTEQKLLVFQGFKGVPSFSKGGFNFLRRWGVKMLISIETYRAYDLPGGSRPYLTSGSAHALIF